jgi:hypothetical protein
MTISKLMLFLKECNASSEVLIGAVDEYHVPYDVVSCPVIETYTNGKGEKNSFKGFQ